MIALLFVFVDPLSFAGIIPVPIDELKLVKVYGVELLLARAVLLGRRDAMEGSLLGRVRVELLKREATAVPLDKVEVALERVVADVVAFIIPVDDKVGRVELEGAAGAVDPGAT